MKGNSYLREAKLHFASGNLEKSIQYFNLAEEHGCNRQEVYLSRGAARIALGLFFEARRDLSVVIGEDNKNERAYYFRGIANIGLGKYQKAIDDFTQSLIRNHDRGIAHLMRGLAYSELGQHNDAVLDINSATAFSEAELKSFHKLFGDKVAPFKNTRAMLAKENAPWLNMLSCEAADTLRSILH
jgi:tetratricopeptide (TPR) repeat protein